MRRSESSSGQVAEQQHAEVRARGQRGAAELVGVELAAGLGREIVEAVPIEQPVELVVEGHRGGLGQVVGHQEGAFLNLLALAHRHVINYSTHCLA